MGHDNHREGSADAVHVAGVVSVCGKGLYQYYKMWRGGGKESGY